MSSRVLRSLQDLYKSQLIFGSSRLGADATVQRIFRPFLVPSGDVQKREMVVTSYSTIVREIELKSGARELGLREARTRELEGLEN